MKKTKGLSVKIISLAMLIPFSACFFSGCNKPSKNSALDESKPVKLVVTGSSPDFKALETAFQDFSAIYPNCTLEYEYLQDYRNTIETRLASETDAPDIFLTDNIQADSPLLPYALELYSCSDKLDLSDTYDGLTNNFKFLGSETEQIYAVPYGAEMRGLYVNTTILNSLGISVPQNKSELLAACETLSQNGYIAFQANPGTFSQQLMFPYITNIIASAENHDEVHNLINSCDDKAAELFREPMSFVYTLVEKNYYNYKYVENELGYFSDSETSACIKNFLNVVDTGSGENKTDDIGKVPFMPGTISMKNQLDKIKDDFHSEIAYEFILSPVSDNGGFAYISPSRGLAINKNSPNTDWALEFLSFIFDEQNNKVFAENNDIIPNTKDAVQYVSKQFNIPENQITQPEDIAFDYVFYSLIYPPLMDVSKGNNPKYMIDNGDGTTSMYDFEYYMDNLKKCFEEQRNAE